MDWVQRVRDGGKGDKWLPNHNSKLCSLHFDEIYIERCITDKNKPLTKLKEDAVPTFFAYVSLRIIIIYNMYINCKIEVQYSIIGN